MIFNLLKLLSTGLTSLKPIMEVMLSSSMNFNGMKVLKQNSHLLIATQLEWLYRSNRFTILATFSHLGLHTYTDSEPKTEWTTVYYTVASQLMLTKCLLHALIL